MLKLLNYIMVWQTGHFSRQLICLSCQSVVRQAWSKLKFNIYYHLESLAHLADLKEVVISGLTKPNSKGLKGIMSTLDHYLLKIVT